MDADDVRLINLKSRNITSRGNFGPTISTTAALIRKTINQGDVIEGGPTAEDLLATQATFLQEGPDYNRRGPIVLLENSTLDYESG